MPHSGAMKGASTPAIRLARIAFVVGLVVVAAIAWTVRDTREKTRLAVQWVMHSQEVLQAIDQVNDRHAVAEVAQRAYMLSGADGMLQARDAALQRVDAAMRNILELTADNARQQAQAHTLKARIAERVSIMRDSQRLRGESAEAALAFIASGIPEAASRQVRLASERLAEAERQLLGVRREVEERRERVAQQVLLFTLFAALFLLTPAYLGFARQSRRRAIVEARLNDLAHQLPVALYQLRRLPDGRWLTEYVSDRSAAVHHVEPEAATRDTDSILATICPEDQERVAARLREADADANESDFEIEYRAGPPDDRCARWVRSSATLRREADGSTIFNGYWADVSEQKALIHDLETAREDAHTANRAKSAFLATMSHEIRTPMNGVLGMLELLDLTRLDGEQRATLGVVRESGRSLLRIIDDILDFSKIEAGRLELNPQVAALRELIERACQLHSGMAGSKGLLLSATIDPDLGAAHLVDPLRLGQILNNLLSNAVKFTPRGSVEVRARSLGSSPEGERVCIEVRDTGIGLTPEQQSLLFQPFAQASRNVAGRYGGTGLGLTICRRLDDMMGGSVEMHSTRDVGTTMTVTLMLPPADPADLRDSVHTAQHDELAATLAARRVAPDAQHAVQDRTLVLVVDDHPVNRVVLLRQVQTLGYAAEAAEHGEQALAMWRTGRFGLVLTDCNMPVMDGYALTRHIRQIEADAGGERTPVIACTANALRGEAEICFEAGMDDFLIKPVALGELMSRLDRWLPLPDSGLMPLDPLEAPAVPVQRPLEHEVLAEIAMDDPVAEREILIDFRRINDEDAFLLRRAVADRDLPQVTRLAHRVKGSSGMVGARELADVCARIENASRAGDLPGVMAQIERFQFELQRLNAYLDTLY